MNELSPIPHNPNTCRVFGCIQCWDFTVFLFQQQAQHESRILSRVDEGE